MDLRANYASLQVVAANRVPPADNAPSHMSALGSGVHTDLKWEIKEARSDVGNVLRRHAAKARHPAFKDRRRVHECTCVMTPNETRVSSSSPVITDSMPSQQAVSEP